MHFINDKLISEKINSIKNYCKEKELEYEVIQDVSHNEILQKMSEFTEFVFMPRGGDTCPRIAIEAKLAGLNIHTNLNTQHIDLIVSKTELFISTIRKK